MLCVGLLAFTKKSASALTHDGAIEYHGVDLLQVENSEQSQGFPVVNATFSMSENFRANFNAGSKWSTREVQFWLSKKTVDIEKNYTVVIGLTNRDLRTAMFDEANIENTLSSLSLDMQGSYGYWSSLQKWQHISESTNALAPYKGIFHSTYAGVSLDTLEAYKFLDAQGLTSQTANERVKKGLNQNINLFVCLLEETYEYNHTNKSDESLDLVPYSAKSIGVCFERVNLTSLSQEKVKSATSAEYYKNLCRWAGYPVKSSNSDTATVNVVYREMQSATTYKDVRTSFQVPWTDGHNEYAVKTHLKNKLGKASYTDFNAVWRDADILDNGNVNLNSERTIFQATGYTYVYDPYTFTGTLTVEYTDFKAKDFAITLKSNDPLDIASIEIYSSNIKTTSDSTIITFDVAKINEQLLNARGWIVDVGEASFLVENTSSVVKYEKGEDYLTLTVPKNNEEELAKVKISAVAQIKEDVDVELTFEYLTFELDESFDIVKKVNESEVFILKYSELLRLSEHNFFNTYGAFIESALYLEDLEGCNYANYDGFTRKIVEVDSKYKLVVEYAYNMVFKIEQPNGDVCYRPVLKTQNEYTLEDLDVEIPEGERVANILVSDNLKIKRSEENFALSNVVINTDTWTDAVGVVKVETTDEYFVVINYLEQYKKTPFAYPKTKSGTAKVLEMPVSGVPVSTFLKKFLDKSNLNLLKSTIESVDVVFNGYDTYTFNVKYTYATIKQIDYNGKITDEVKIPLTRFASWTESFGKDWSIMFLNMPTATYFEYSQVEAPDGTVISSDNLYGYFSQAVFEENVIDLNYYFKGFSGDGVVSLFESVEASGGVIYTALGNVMNRVDNFFIDIHIQPILAFCELVNDENKMFHSYFFYLDCSTAINQTFISNGKADSVDDSDGAFGNTVENVGDKVVDLTGKIFLNEDGNLSLFWWVVIGIAALVVMVIIVKKAK